MVVAAQACKCLLPFRGEGGNLGGAKEKCGREMWEGRCEHIHTKGLVVAA